MKMDIDMNDASEAVRTSRMQNTFDSFGVSGRPPRKAPKCVSRRGLKLSKWLLLNAKREIMMGLKCGRIIQHTTMERYVDGAVS